MKIGLFADIATGLSIKLKTKIYMRLFLIHWFLLRWQCEKDHQTAKLESECKNRKNKLKCEKYFRTLLDQGKNVEKIFKFQKLKREHCESKSCKKRKQQNLKKLKREMKKELKKKKKKTSNGPRFRSAKKGMK
jgi:hypothetical protein